MSKASARQASFGKKRHALFQKCAELTKQYGVNVLVR